MNYANVGKIIVELPGLVSGASVSFKCDSHAFDRKLEILIRSTMHEIQYRAVLPLRDLHTPEMTARYISQTATRWNDFVRRTLDDRRRMMESVRVSG